jgi:sec-independent protein translocase protein TatA
MPEMFAIFVVALLLFGPKKLPELGRTLGKALSEFRRAKNELKGTFESHLRELERETQLPTNSSSSSPTNYSSGYSYPYEDYNHYNSDLPAYSGPSKIEGTEEPHASLPASAGELGGAPEQLTPQHEAVPVSPPVSGTIPRSNGVRPLEQNVESEGHPAEAREEHPV